MPFIGLCPQSAHICRTNLFEINIYIILTHMPIAPNMISFCECSKVTSARTFSRPMHTTYPAHLKPIYLSAEVQQTSGSQSEPLKLHSDSWLSHFSLPVGSCNQTAPSSPETKLCIILLQPLHNCQYLPAFIMSTMERNLNHC